MRQSRAPTASQLQVSRDVHSALPIVLEQTLIPTPEPSSTALQHQVRSSLRQGKLRYVSIQIGNESISTATALDGFAVGYELVALTLSCYTGHALRRNAGGAFGPDLAKKLSQLVKMEKNVMRSMETVAKERMEVAVSYLTPIVLRLSY